MITILTNALFHLNQISIKLVISVDSNIVILSLSPMQRDEEMSITKVHVTAEAAAVGNTVVMCAIKRFFTHVMYFPDLG